MYAVSRSFKIAMALGLIFLAAWLLGSRSTDKRHLKVCPSRRAWRAIRSAYVSAILSVIGWPHVVDLLLRTKRAAVGATPSEVVWTSSTNATLRRYSGKRRGGRPILVVHSVITEPWILDLARDHSLIGHLVGEGHDVYLLDWGDAGAAQAAHGLANYVDVLRAAERVVLRLSRKRKLDLVGYCLGGTICLIHAAVDSATHVRSIVAIAPPIDLSAGGKLAKFLRHPLLRPAQLLDADSCVPAAVVRETFHALRPRALRSVTMGWRLRREPVAMAYYGAMARWAWEQRRLSGAMFMDLVALFRSNALLRGELRLGDKPVDLTRIKCRVLVLVAERDHIVPLPASMPLRTGGTLESVIVPSGHVSMVVGTGARDATWPALARWLKPARRLPPRRKTTTGTPTSRTVRSRPRT